jgi:hypothetical protein
LNDAKISNHIPTFEQVAIVAKQLLFAKVQ